MLGVWRAEDEVKNGAPAPFVLVCMQCTGTISSGGFFSPSGSFKAADIKTLEKYHYLYVVFYNNLCFESHVGVLKKV